MAETAKEVKQQELVDPANAGKLAGGITPPAAPTIKDVTVDGYTFQVDTDRIDDVEILDTIDAIENKGNLKEIVTFLQWLVGDEGYQKLHAYFVEKDGRFRLSKLADVYQAIFAEFDPKG